MLSKYSESSHDHYVMLLSIQCVDCLQTMELTNCHDIMLRLAPYAEEARVRKWF